MVSQVEMSLSSIRSAKLIRIDYSQLYFLLVIISNHGCICHHFRDTLYPVLLKNAHFSYPPSIQQ